MPADVSRWVAKCSLSESMSGWCGGSSAAFRPSTKSSSQSDKVPRLVSNSQGPSNHLLPAYDVPRYAENLASCRSLSRCEPFLFDVENGPASYFVSLAAPV